MSVNIFSDADIKKLIKNKYIKNVSHKGITYTDEFKRLFIAEQEKGKTPRQIFEECGISFDLIGESRVRNCAYRWKNNYRNDGILGLLDSRKLNSGRPRDKELTDKEKIEKLEIQNKFLKAENELLKKVDLMERRLMPRK